jgi:Ser/Thr protein kinase RdoA (MazF antagonist)
VSIVAREVTPLAEARPGRGNRRCPVALAGKTRGVELAAEIAVTFALGKVHEPLVPAAVGWGGHNKVFRLETRSGSWAIKQLGRPPAPDPEAAFAIEMAAYEGGVPMAPPVATTTGRCWAEIGGALFRCHRWIDGSAKENAETSPPEAAAMGRVVAHIHRLAIACSPPPESQIRIDAQRWRALAAAGERRGCGWAKTLAGAIETVVRIADGPTPAQLGGDELVGSHRDLNAHNVLFSESGLRLVDWDAAGPAWPRWERVDFALRWAERPGGRYDEGVLRAFLQGYLDAGGVLDRDDPAVVAAAPAALVPWVVQNLEMALETPSDEQDRLAGALLDALLAMPHTVRERQAELVRCLSRL